MLYNASFCIVLHLMRIHLHVRYAFNAHVFYRVYRGYVPVYVGIV